MPANKMERLWFILTASLVIIIIAGTLIIWLNRDPGQSLNIEPPQSPLYSGEINIEGAVLNPGNYPLKSGDSIDNIIQASGGLYDNADLNHIYLHVPYSDAVVQSQKIDINRADAWLLQALPGIGEVRSRAIIDYRNRNGPFRSTEELLKVPGITNSIFAKIRDYITILD